MPGEETYLITMRTSITNLGDIKVEVTSSDPVKALIKAIETAKKQQPELKAAAIPYCEIELIG